MPPQSLIREVHCNEVSEPGFPAVQAIFEIALEWGASKKLVIAWLRLAYKRTAFAAGSIMTHIVGLSAMQVVDTDRICVSTDPPSCAPAWRRGQGQAFGAAQP